MIDVLTVRGTGEPMNDATNMLAGVTTRLDRTRFHVVGDVPYPAAVGPANEDGDPNGPSEATSVADGVAAMAAMIRTSQHKVGILGYSLGSLVVTKFRELQAAGQFGDCELAWSACVANPLRRAGESIDPNPYGYGINGQRRDFAGDAPHLEAANPADGITSCAPDSPLRAVADGLSAFSFAELGGWTQALATDLLRQRFQPVSWGWWLHPVRTWQLYDEAARDVTGYLSGKTHIRDYIDGGYCSRLGARINSL